MEMERGQQAVPHRVQTDHCLTDNTRSGRSAASITGYIDNTQQQDDNRQKIHIWDICKASMNYPECKC